MKKYICHNCGNIYEYCRGCLLSPISYKENGFCSKICQETYHNKIKEVVPAEDVEVVVIDEDTSTPKEEVIECPHFFTAIDNEMKKTVSDTTEIEKPKKRKNRILHEIIEENNINEDEQDYRENVLGE